MSSGPLDTKKNTAPFRSKQGKKRNRWGREGKKSEKALAGEGGSVNHKKKGEDERKKKVDADET